MPSSKEFIRVSSMGVRIPIRQWDLICFLGPHWREFTSSDFSKQVASSIEENGWAEFKRFESFTSGILTEDGMAFRDSIMIRLARRRDNRA